MANRHFTGRESTLDELKQKLFVQASTEKLALFGLGGIGKTQVALQLAYWVKANVPECSIFWAPALSLETFEQACWQIAKEFQIPRKPDESAMELIRRHLSSDKAGKWLFIVDNADDIDLLFDELHQYFPTGGQNGVTLLTTRSREVAELFAETDTVQLKEMTAEEGIEFLAKIIGKDSLCSRESATQLLEELKLLPLAIVQAACYIRRNNGTTMRYLELMHKTQKDRMRLASRDFRDITRYRETRNAVTATWLISFDQIKSSDPPAAGLLEFMSYLEPKAIPRSLLPTLDSEEEMDFAIGTLCGYGFLTRRDNSDQDIFDIHSLVQLSTRVWIAEARKTQEIITTVTQHMDKCFPSDEYTNRATWRIYLPHALGILSREENKDLSERYSLHSKVGECILADGRVKEAVAAFKEVCVWKEASYDEEHPSRLMSEYILASAYRSNGQNKKSIELLEHVVAVERILDKEDPSRLASQHELARAYQSNGQTKQAVELIKHVVTIFERTLDEGHPDLLRSQHTLAVAYRFNGQIKQAVEILEHVVAVRERTLDEEHPDRLVSQYELAVAYRFNGQIKQAVEILEHVVAVRERTLDEEHPDRLASQFELAVAYRFNGQIKQAVEISEHVLAVSERTLDEEHPSRLASQHELAVAYQFNGQIKQAVELLEHVVTIRERTLDEEHPDRLASQYELAGAYRFNGQIKQAVEISEHVLAVSERTLDEEHPNRLASQFELAMSYQSNGQTKQAVELLELVVAVEEITLDEEHPKRILAQKALKDAKKRLIDVENTENRLS
jgi:tetratricopeptide (TPR) repeat protein